MSAINKLFRKYVIDPPAEGVGLGIRIQVVCQSREVVSLDQRVVVEEDEYVAPSLLHSAVAGVREALLRFENVFDRQFGMGFQKVTDLLGCPVRTVVVDDNDFVVTVLCRRDFRDGLYDVALSVIGADNY